MTSVRHRCRYDNGSTDGRGRKSFLAETNAEGLRNGVDRRGLGSQDAAPRRPPISAITNGGGPNDMTHALTWTELAREAAHVSVYYYQMPHDEKMITYLLYILILNLSLISNSKVK